MPALPDNVRDQLAADARTVAQADEYLQELKSQADAIFDPAAVASHGYITPSGEIHLRQLQFSYWKTRNALYELVYDIWRNIERLDRATPQQFLVALAAASLLVDAARFLREKFHRTSVVRRKLDEPDIVHGIPPRMYDEVQKSLTSPYHAWYLWQATRYYDRHRSKFLDAARTDGLEPMVAIIDRLRDRLRPSLPVYLRTRMHVRGPAGGTAARPRRAWPRRVRPAGSSRPRNGPRLRAPPPRPQPATRYSRPGRRTIAARRRAGGPQGIRRHAITFFPATGRMRPCFSAR